MQRNLCHHNTSTGTYRTYTASGPVYESPDKAVWCGVGELSDGRQFFVKILDCGRIADAETAAGMAKLYLTEARTLKTIEDCRVSVPKCYDYWRDNRTGQSVIVMERMKGVSLREWMRAHPAQNLSRRDVRERLDILLQICRIMKRIYEKHPNVIHRDLKPENILIEENRNRSRKVSVVDFGCAGQDRMRIGTVNYQSPEQTGIFTGNIGISTKNDIFSIGQIGYELFTGEVPVIGRDYLYRLGNNEWTETPSLPRDLMQIPGTDRLDGLLSGMTRLNSEDRPVYSFIIGTLDGAARTMTHSN